MGQTPVMKLDDALRGITFLGFDTSPFIYFVERNLLYVDLVREVFRRLTDGDFQAYSSVITLTEVLVRPLQQGDKAITDRYRDFLFNRINFQLLTINPATAEYAAEIRAKYNLRTPDALQIAAALDHGCEAFLCNDAGLRRVTEIRVLVRDDLEL